MFSRDTFDMMVETLEQIEAQYRGQDVLHQKVYDEMRKIFLYCARENREFLTEITGFLAISSASVMVTAIQAVGHMVIHESEMHEFRAVVHASIERVGADASPAAAEVCRDIRAVLEPRQQSGKFKFRSSEEQAPEPKRVRASPWNTPTDSPQERAAPWNTPTEQTGSALMRIGGGGGVYQSSRPMSINEQAKRPVSIAEQAKRTMSVYDRVGASQPDELTAILGRGGAYESNTFRPDRNPYSHNTSRFTRSDHETAGSNATFGPPRNVFSTRSESAPRRNPFDTVLTGGSEHASRFQVLDDGDRNGKPTSSALVRNPFVLPRNTDQNPYAVERRTGTGELLVTKKDVERLLENFTEKVVKTATEEATRAAVKITRETVQSETAILLDKQTNELKALLTGRAGASAPPPNVNPPKTFSTGSGGASAPSGASASSSVTEIACKFLFKGLKRDPLEYTTQQIMEELVIPKNKAMREAYARLAANPDDHETRAEIYAFLTKTTSVKISTIRHMQSTMGTGDLYELLENWKRTTPPEFIDSAMKRKKSAKITTGDAADTSAGSDDESGEAGIPETDAGAVLHTVMTYSSPTGGAGGAAPPEFE